MFCTTRFPLGADPTLPWTLCAQIIAAVQMYDRMSKPAELDSDDEAVEEAKRLAQQQGLSMPASATPQHGTTGGGRNNDDTQSIRSALSNFDLQDREVDKLQMQQRRRLQRHLSSRGGPSSSSVHPDLQDLAFGPSGRYVFRRVLVEFDAGPKYRRLLTLGLARCSRARLARRFRRRFSRFRPKTCTATARCRTLAITLPRRKTMGSSITVTRRQTRMGRHPRAPTPPMSARRTIAQQQPRRKTRSRTRLQTRTREITKS